MLFIEYGIFYNLNEKEREKYIKKKLDELANLQRTYIGAIERGGKYYN